MLLCLYVNRIAAGLSLFLFLQWELVSTVIYGIYKVQLKRSKCINFHANEQNTFWGFINNDIFVKYCLNISD